MRVLVPTLVDAATTFCSDGPECFGSMLECVSGSLGSLSHSYYKTTRVIAASHPKIKDYCTIWLMDMLLVWPAC